MSSRRLRSGQTPRRRNASNSNNSAADFGACIDLTVDIGGDEVIDLTNHTLPNIMDSPVVIISPSDNVGPVRRRRGSGRRGARRSSLYNRSNRPERSSLSSPSLDMPSSSGLSRPNIEINSDDELPDLPFEIPKASVEANASYVKSPALKITCPVCLDDFKQIKSSNRRVMSTICGHIFCEECITSAIRSLKSCPSCRKSLALNKIHPIFL